MGNILHKYLGFFCFQLILRFHVNRKKSLGQQFNKTLVFYNFFRNALEILGLKSWDLKTFCVFTVDVTSVGRFPIAMPMYSPSFRYNSHDNIWEIDVYLPFSWYFTLHWSLKSTLLNLQTKWGLICPKNRTVVKVT